MNKSAAYFLGGHGCEMIGEFGKRSVLPQGVTLITFAPCGRTTDADDDAWMLNHGRMDSKETRDLYQYPFADDHLTKLKEKHKNIRVYPPGSLIPNLRFFPFSSWELSGWTTIPKEDGLLVSLSGIIPLFESKDPNPKWKDLHDDSAEEAGLDSGGNGAWCYTSAPEKDQDAAFEYEEEERDSEEAIANIIQAEDVILEFPHYQFSHIIDSDKDEWLSYTELLLGDDYREYKKTGEIPDYVYRYIYQHSIYRPYTTERFYPKRYQLDMLDVVELCQKHARTNNIVLYWNVCRSPCAGQAKEAKAMLPLIRSQSDIQQRGVSNFLEEPLPPSPVPAPVPAPLPPSPVPAPVPAPAVPAAAAVAAAGVGALEAAGAGPQPIGEFDEFVKFFEQYGGKRRKTYRKNLRKTRKSKKKWTRTKRSRSRRS